MRKLPFSVGLLAASLCCMFVLPFLSVPAILNSRSVNPLPTPASAPSLLSFGTHILNNGTFGPALGLGGGIAVGQTGLVYVADYGNNRVQIFNSAGAFIGFLGTSGTGYGQISDPIAIAVNNATGRIYVAEPYSILMYSSTGTFIGQFGSAGAGPGEFARAQGIAVNNNTGDVYLTDFGNNRVLHFDASGNYLGQIGTSGTGNGQFEWLTGIAVNSSGDIYVCDLENKIQIFDQNGNYLSKLGAGLVTSPQAIAINATGYVYECEIGSFQIFNPNGNYVGDFGLLSYQIAINSVSGNAYVVDSEHCCVNIFDVAENFIGQFGIESYSEPGQFDSPMSVAINTSGAAYVIDEENSRVEVFNSAGIYLNQFGTFGTSDGYLSYPEGIAINSTGAVYVADTDNNRVEIFSSMGTYLGQFSTWNSGANTFNTPVGIAINRTGAIYVADTNHNQTEIFDQVGNFLGQFGTSGSGNGQFNEPTGIAINNVTGNVYVADKIRIQIFSPNGTFLGGVGNYPQSSPWPHGIAIDSNGSVYVCDPSGNSMLVYGPAGGLIENYGTSGTSLGQFNSPEGIAINTTGAIYVADTRNNRVQILIPPPAPALASITPSLNMNGSITLSWSSCAGAFYYDLFRSTTPIYSAAGLTPVGTPGGTSTQDGVPANGTYYYAVAAANAAGIGPISAWQSVVVTVSPPPSPTLAEISPSTSSNGSITLTWNTCTNATSYAVYRSTAEIFTLSGTTLVTSTGSTSTTDTVTTNGTYYYVVVASNIGGSSSISNCQSVSVQIPPTAAGGNNQNNNNGIPGYDLLAITLFAILGTTKIYVVVRKKSALGISRG